MPNPEQGRIVFVEVPDPQGQNIKVRPAVIISETSEIKPGESIVCVAVTGELPKKLTGEWVLLPYSNGGHPRTGLKKKCAAMCSWLIEITEDQIRARRRRAVGAGSRFSCHPHAGTHKGALCPAFSGEIPFHGRPSRLEPGQTATFGLRRLLLVFLAPAGRVDGTAGGFPFRMGPARSWPEGSFASRRDATGDRSPGKFHARELGGRERHGLAASTAAPYHPR